MFLICSGGLEKACDAFCNLLIDVGDKWTAKEVAESEEAWWLRRACQRGRCRLIERLASAFGVRVQSIQVKIDKLIATPIPFFYSTGNYLCRLEKLSQIR